VSGRDPSRTLGRDELPPEQAAVARHYAAQGLELEVVRLERYSPAELAITQRYLERYVPAGVLVADVGVGVGHYAELLARRGCALHLVDIAEGLLEATERRLAGAGLAHAVRGVHRASATDLHCFEDASLGAVLMLGPLYHLRDPADRRRAVSEAWRILQPGGVLLAAGINRLAYLRELLREYPEESVPRREFHRRFLSDGRLDPEHAPPIGYAHLTTVAEFRALFADGFDELALVGTESFAAVWQTALPDLSGEAREAWLDLIEATGRTPEGIGQSDHFLFVGRRRAGSERGVSR
jgi:SAM-dependent methyltransferase